MYWKDDQISHTDTTENSQGFIHWKQNVLVEFFLCHWIFGYYDDTVLESLGNYWVH